MQGKGKSLLITIAPCPPLVIFLSTEREKVLE